MALSCVSGGAEQAAGHMCEQGQDAHRQGNQGREQAVPLQQVGQTGQCRRALGGGGGTGMLLVGWGF